MYTRRGLIFYLLIENWRSMKTVNPPLDALLEHFKKWFGGMSKSRNI